MVATGADVPMAWLEALAPRGTMARESGVTNRLPPQAEHIVPVPLKDIEECGVDEDDCPV